ncbi:MAG: hypothetical protein ACC658_11575 [Acidimicrobiia bacterium]
MKLNRATTPVVLWPGTLCNDRLFDGQIEALRERAEVTIGTCTDFEMSTESGKSVTRWAAGLVRRNSDIKCVADEGARK